MRNALRFPDLVLLKVLEERASDFNGVVYVDMADLANQWLREHRVPLYYAPPFSYSMKEFTETLRTLMGLRLAERGRGRRRGFYATEDAELLLLFLGDDWRTWPLSIPIRGRELIFRESVYAEDFRREL